MCFQMRPICDVLQEPRGDAEESEPFAFEIHGAAVKEEVMFLVHCIQDTTDISLGIDYKTC